MTLEEAIIQFKEDADNNRADLDMQWAEENEQVAKWLEELKAIKEGVVFYSNRPIEDIVLEARANAIDEVLKLPRNTYKTYEHGFIENEEAIFVSDILDLKEQKCLI